MKHMKVCEQCYLDGRHTRDADAECIHCGVNLCGGHIMEHLQKTHCVGTHLYEKEVKK
ncbi:MAG: hypothetical protein NTX92_02490 [Euryarchaeota archaeon]|nr:hypothetical protein [Euryarchaeota archaeon]